MDLILILTFLHILSAIVWLGGGLAMVLLGSFLGPQARPDQLVTVLRFVVLLAPRLFVPFSLATLLTGLALAITGGYGWPAWLVLGLAGVAFTALFGGLVLGPSAERGVRLADSEGASAAMPLAKRLFRLGKFDYTVQFAIVFLMVAKPGWSDVTVLASVGAVVLAGAALFLRPSGQPMMTA